MKKSTLSWAICFGVLTFPFLAKAQQDIPDDSQIKSPAIIVGIGLGAQIFFPAMRATSLTIERPRTPYHRFGLGGHYYLREYVNKAVGGGGVTGNSFEVGFYSKHFYKGRLSARRSAFYWGLELRMGRRDYYYEEIIFSGSSSSAHDRHTTVKIMGLAGAQFRMGRAIIDIGLPIGIEQVYGEDDSINNFSYSKLDYAKRNKLFMMPTLILGYSF